MTVRIITTSACDSDPRELARKTAGELRDKAGDIEVAGGILFATAQTKVERFRDSLAGIMPNVPFAGFTSCLGVGVDGKLLSGNGAVAGLWFAGDGVFFGVHSAPLGLNPEKTGRILAREALRKAGLSPEEAGFAILLPTPGNEEALLKGCYDQLGEDAIIVGGTAADNDLTGKWRVWSNDFSTGKGAALAVGHWPKEIAVSYRGGYLATEKKAVVTKSSGRIIEELDNKPAAEVYNDWLDGKLDDYLDRGGTVLGVSTLTPLGVVRGSFGGVDAYILVHPEKVIPEDKSLTAFAEIKEGETVVLMQSTKKSLVARGADVAQWAMNLQGFSKDDLAGGLMMYCGGCVLAIEDEMQEMLSKLGDKLNPAPWIAGFSFGEQGCVIPRKVDHGNLMNAVLLFER